ASDIPKFQEVAGRAARGRDDRVASLGCAIEQSDQLALTHYLAFPIRKDLLLYLRDPRTSGPGHFALIGVAMPTTGGQGRFTQGHDREPRVGHDRERTLLAGIVRANIDVDEPNVRVAEARLRAGGKIGQARSD